MQRHNKKGLLWLCKTILLLLGKATKTVIISMIKCYHYTLSPYVGHCCRFTPSCSQYALLAIEKEGIFFGCWLALKRLLKCHPWSKGGVDLI